VCVGGGGTPRECCWSEGGGAWKQGKGLGARGPLLVRKGAVRWGVGGGGARQGGIKNPSRRP